MSAPRARRPDSTWLQGFAMLCFAVAGLNPHDLKFAEDDAEGDEWDEALRKLTSRT
jgi:hypothetical protein